MKVYKSEITGGSTFFIALPDTYTAIATDLGFTATSQGDIKAGDITPSHAELIKGGCVFQVSLGFAGKKRGRCLISLEKVSSVAGLVGKTLGGKTITSASIRTYTKLA
jgi:hypothetical protein